MIGARGTGYVHPNLTVDEAKALVEAADYCGSQPVSESLSAPDKRRHLIEGMDALKDVLRREAGVERP